MATLEVVHPIEFKSEDRRTSKSGCLIVIPSGTDKNKIAWWPSQFGMSLAAQQVPLNFAYAFFTVENKEVGEARNLAVEHAVKIGAEYLLFKDNDTMAPPRALSMLFHLDVDIAAAVYYSKQWPSYPLIFKFPQLAGVRDWKFGDVLEDIDAVGMGCCLIRTKVFDKLEKPWFRTIRKGMDFADPVAHWAGEQARMMDDPDAIRGDMTEDIYFCLKAKKAGFKVHAHTGVQCAHLDTGSGITYLYEESVGDVVMITTDAKMIVHPKADSPLRKIPEPEVVLEEVKFNLGCGGSMLPGFINVDLFTDGADEQCDVRDLTPLVHKYGKAEEIHSSHTLEHISFRETLKILRNWVWALKPGGKLAIRVPDLEWVLKHWLEVPNDDPMKYDFEMAKIFGLQMHPGEFHHAGFTVDLFERLLNRVDVEDVKVEAKKLEDKNQGEVYVEATKAAVPAGLAADDLADASDG